MHIIIYLALAHFLFIFRTAILLLVARYVRLSVSTVLIAWHGHGLYMDPSNIYNYLISPLDQGYTWIYCQGKICRQFRWLLWTLFIGQFVEGEVMR